MELSIPSSILTSSDSRLALLNSIYIYEGYKNFIEEVVRRGYQKARLFGYPTANIRNSINLPCGVYQGSTNYNKSATIYSNSTDELECHIHEGVRDFIGNWQNIVLLKPHSSSLSP